MIIQAVIGANYGDEGKGLVSGCLAREASKRGDKTLTVFYNGTNQRAHTFEGEIHRATAAGAKYGSDTCYHPMFVVDPISLYLLQAKDILIDPKCRVILPWDVLMNRQKERLRGEDRHGSCGFGLFEAVRRDQRSSFMVRVYDFLHPYELYQKLKRVRTVYYRNGLFQNDDELYNPDIFMRAVSFITKNCRIIPFKKIIRDYDTVIFEGGQGLMLDQGNVEDFPHLTPSNTGLRNIVKDIGHSPAELYYVSRSYLTRHGAGPIENECTKEDIHPDLTDNTNRENEFQGGLRFGKIDIGKLEKRIRKASAGRQKN